MKLNIDPRSIITEVPISYINLSKDDLTSELAKEAIKGATKIMFAIRKASATYGCLTAASLLLFIQSVTLKASGDKTSSLKDLGQLVGGWLFLFSLYNCYRCYRQYRILQIDYLPQLKQIANS